MRRGTKIALFIGLGILVIGVLVCVIAFVLNGFSTRNIVPRGDGQKGAYNTIEKEFKEDFSDIEIAVASADVKVLQSKDNTARIEYECNAEDPEIEAAVENNTLVFRSLDTSDGLNWKEPAQLWDQLESLVSSGSISEKELRLYLPEKDYRRLEIATASGDILSDHMFSVSETSLTAVSGDIELSGLKNAEYLYLTITSGELQVSDMDVRSHIEAVSTSGDISFEQVNCMERMKVLSTSGKISLINSAYKTTDLETVSGDILLENLNSETLHAKTISGDISGKIDPDIHVSYKTISGSCSAPNGKRDDWNLETTSGDINLKS